MSNKPQKYGVPKTEEALEQEQKYKQNGTCTQEQKGYSRHSCRKKFGFGF